MKRKLKKALDLLKAGRIKELFIKFGHLCSKPIYRIRARWEDWRLGRVSVNGTIPSKFRKYGAYAVQSTDYRCLDKIFSVRPLDENASFVDIGCGEGRVLTYLHLRGFRGKLVGIELDPDAAATAEKRTETCPNVRIVCSHVLAAGDIIAGADTFYLFNPFQEQVLSKFIELVEARCTHPVVLYYSYDLHKSAIDGRERWEILHRGHVDRPGSQPYPFTIYRYTP